MLNEKNDNKKSVQTIIVTSLPYCLYRVDSRFFELGDINNTKIKFIKIETVPNRRTHFSRNIEVIRDRWGIDAHSDVEITTDRNFDIENNNEAENFALGLINDFIKRYKYFDKDAVHLVSLTHEDLIGLSITSNGQGVMSVRMSGGMTAVMPQRNEEISNKIELSLSKKEEIPLWEELLLNSEQYLYQVEYRHSILESIISLELVISAFIRKKCHEKGISTKDAKNYIKDVGLTGNIKVTLQLLLDDKELPNYEIVRKCKAGITIRNKIVHEGRKNISREEVQECLSSCKSLIQFLIPYL